MEIFTRVKLLLRFVGLVQFDVPNAHIIALILKISVAFSIICAMSASAAFLITETEAPFDIQIQCFATIIVDVYGICTFAIFVVQIKNFIKVMKVLEDVIDERNRKYGRTIYAEINDEVEDFTMKVTTFVASTVFPLFVVSTSAISYYNYYVRGRGEASFMLYSPMT